MHPHTDRNHTSFFCDKNVVIEHEFPLKKVFFNSLTLSSPSFPKRSHEICIHIHYVWTQNQHPEPEHCLPLPNPILKHRFLISFCVEAKAESKVIKVNLSQAQNLCLF